MIFWADFAAACRRLRRLGPLVSVTHVSIFLPDTGVGKLEASFLLPPLLLGSVEGAGDGEGLLVSPFVKKEETRGSGDAWEGP